MPRELDFLTELKEALSKIGQNQQTIDDNGSGTQRTGGFADAGRTQPLTSSTTSAADETDADVATDTRKTTAAGPDCKTREMANGSDEQRRYLTKDSKKSDSESMAPISSAGTTSSEDESTRKKVPESENRSKEHLLFELSRVLQKRKEQGSKVTQDVWDFENRPKTGRSVVYPGKEVTRDSFAEDNTKSIRLSGGQDAKRQRPLSDSTSSPTTSTKDAGSLQLNICAESAQVKATTSKGAIERTSRRQRSFYQDPRPSCNEDFGTIPMQTTEREQQTGKLISDPRFAEDTTSLRCQMNFSLNHSFRHINGSEKQKKKTDEEIPDSSKASTQHQVLAESGNIRIAFPTTATVGTFPNTRNSPEPNTSSDNSSNIQVDVSPYQPPPPPPPPPPLPPPAPPLVDASPFKRSMAVKPRRSPLRSDATGLRGLSLLMSDDIALSNEEEDFICVEECVTSPVGDIDKMPFEDDCGIGTSEKTMLLSAAEKTACNSGVDRQKELTELVEISSVADAKSSGQQSESMLPFTTNESSERDFWQMRSFLTDQAAPIEAKGTKGSSMSVSPMSSSSSGEGLRKNFEDSLSDGSKCQPVNGTSSVPFDRISAANVDFRKVKKDGTDSAAVNDGYPGEDDYRGHATDYRDDEKETRLHKLNDIGSKQATKMVEKGDSFRRETFNSLIALFSANCNGQNESATQSQCSLVVPVKEQDLNTQDYLQSESSTYQKRKISRKVSETDPHFVNDGFDTDQFVTADNLQSDQCPTGEMEIQSSAVGDFGIHQEFSNPEPNESCKQETKTLQSNVINDSTTRCSETFGPMSEQNGRSVLLCHQMEERIVGNKSGSDVDDDLVLSSTGASLELTDESLQSPKLYDFTSASSSDPDNALCAGTLPPAGYEGICWSGGIKSFHPVGNYELVHNQSSARPCQGHFQLDQDESSGSRRICCLCRPVVGCHSAEDRESPGDGGNCHDNSSSNVIVKRNEDVNFVLSTTDKSRNLVEPFTRGTLLRDHLQAGKEDAQNLMELMSSLRLATAYDMDDIVVCHGERPDASGVGGRPDGGTPTTFRDSGCPISDVSWCSQTVSEHQDCLRLTLATPTDPHEDFPTGQPCCSSSNGVRSSDSEDCSSCLHPALEQTLGGNEGLQDGTETTGIFEVSRSKSYKVTRNLYDIISVDDSTSLASLHPAECLPIRSTTAAATAMQKTVFHSQSEPNRRHVTTSGGADDRTFATFPLTRNSQKCSSPVLTADDKDIITNLLITHSGEPLPGCCQRSSGRGNQRCDQSAAPLGAGQTFQRRPGRHVDLPLSVSVTVPEPTSFHQHGNRICQHLIGAKQRLHQVPQQVAMASGVAEDHFRCSGTINRLKADEQQRLRQERHVDFEQQNMCSGEGRSGRMQISCDNWIRRGVHGRDFESTEDDDDGKKEQDGEKEEEEEEEVRGQSTTDRSSVLPQSEDDADEDEEADDDEFSRRLLSDQPRAHHLQPLLLSETNRHGRSQASRRIKKSVFSRISGAAGANVYSVAAAAAAAAGGDDMVHSSDADTESLCQEMRGCDEEFARSLIDYVKRQDLADITEDIKSLYRYQIDAAAIDRCNHRNLIDQLTCCFVCARISHRSYRYSRSTAGGSALDLTAAAATGVTASGSGLYWGAVGRTSVFYVDINETQGSLKIQVEGPRVPARCFAEAESDSRYQISYTPEEVGLYTVRITWNNVSIAGSPFQAKIIDPRQVQAVGGWNKLISGKGRLPLRLNHPTTIEFNSKNAGPGHLTAKVIGPEGELPVQVTSSGGKHRHSVTFKPRSEGDYYVSVFWGGLPINCCNIVGVAVRRDGDESEETDNLLPLSHLLLSGPSDIRPVVASSADATKVVCKGPGLTHGSVGQNIEIQIDTQSAGQGELAVSCSGPVKMIPSKLIDNRNGFFTMLTKPQEPGVHRIQIKFNQNHVPGSPFNVLVTESSSCSDAASAAATSDGDFASSSSNNNNNDIIIRRIRVTGPGIENGVLSTFDSRFTVETKGTGHGQLTVKVRGPRGAFHVEMRRRQPQQRRMADGTAAAAAAAGDGDRSIECRYSPREIGIYVIHVQWSNVNVTGSPFRTHIFESAEELNRFKGDDDPPLLPAPLPLTPTTTDNHFRSFVSNHRSSNSDHNEE